MAPATVGRLTALPEELAKLFGDDGTGRSLTIELPAGRLASPDPDRVIQTA